MSRSSRWDVDEQEVWCLTLEEENAPIASLSDQIFPTLSLKERAPSASSERTGGAQSGGSTCRTSLTNVRSRSLSRSRDSAASCSGAGGSLKRNVFGNQAARQSRPAVGLSSSRSFSSLNTSSLTAAPFMRNSRSLNRLDQRSTGEGTWLIGLAFAPDLFSDLKRTIIIKS